MNEATWVIIAGLIFDIVGAILIVNPILNYIKKFKGSEFGEKVTYYQPKDSIRGDYEKDYKNQRKARIGLVLLLIGFCLQIIGNLLQNPPSF